MILGIYHPAQGVGHDTGVAYADRWFSQSFGPLVSDPHFMQDLVMVATFDESGASLKNHIYTALFGSGVKPGSTSNTLYTHYSLLRTVEEAFALGTLGQKDATASLITGIWK